MGTTRYASVLGLGFGDCGKGHFVDALTRHWHAHTVARFNGGAQAGHNVVIPAGTDSAGLHHTFSQFGAGTFVPGTRTVLLDPMVVHPTSLLVEAETLGRIGIHDALSRLTIDARCRVTTPYHQAAGRLRERLRGAAAHGTCGVGVGETVGHGLVNPEQVFHYADLLPATTANTKNQIDRLQVIRKTLLAEFSAQCPEGSAGAACDEFRALRDETLGGNWLMIAQTLARQCPPAPIESIHSQLTQPGSVLFEGAQGVLLDEWRGFHPHTTWSSISTKAVESAATSCGIAQPIEHYGVLRTYLTRHGPGPLPTHDPVLDDQLPEPHNTADGWQGAFRRGHTDAVLLRYALEAVGPLSGLLISHLDVFQRGVKLKWCERYTSDSTPDVEQLPLGGNKDLAHQSMLTDLLLGTRPQYAAELVGSAPAFLDRVADITSLPVVLHSFGPMCSDMRGN